MNIVDLSLVRKGRDKLALAKMLGHETTPRSAANVKQWEKTLQTIGENEMEYERKCKYILCGKTFMAARKDKDFCCDSHRTGSHKLRESEPSDLAKLMMRAVEFDAQYYGHVSNPDAKRARNAALQDVHAAIGVELEIVHVEAAVEAPVEAAVEVAAVEAPVEAAVEAPVEAAVVRAKLRAFMSETSFGQRKIALLAGVGQSSISRFLTGETDGSPSFRQSILDVILQDHGMDRR